MSTTDLEIYYEAMFKNEDPIPERKSASVKIKGVDVPVKPTVKPYNMVNVLKESSGHYVFDPLGSLGCTSPTVSDQGPKTVTWYRDGNVIEEDETAWLSLILNKPSTHAL